MLVAVDLGNSSVKFGTFEDGRMTGCERFQAGRTLAEDLIAPPQLFRAGRVIVLASAPRRVEEFLAWCPVPVLLVGRDIPDRAVRSLVRTSYDDPSALGLDRIAAALGARERTGGGPVVVVQAGTAITADALGPGDEFHAIGIAPGLRSAARGLHDAAPHLPLPLFGGADAPIPARSTEDSIRNGHLLGTAGLIDRLAEAAASCLSVRPAFVLAGGDAITLAPHLRTPFLVEPDAALWGIHAIDGAVRAAGGGR